MLTLSNELLNEYVEGVKTKLRVNAGLMAMVKADGDDAQYHYYLAKEMAYHEMLWMVGINPGDELYSNIKRETMNHYIEELERYQRMKEDSYYD